MSSTTLVHQIGFGPTKKRLQFKGTATPLTSAAFAAALLASSVAEDGSAPPRVRPGVLLVILAGTEADVGWVCALEPTIRPGVAKLSGWFDDFEQRFPMVRGLGITIGCDKSESMLICTTSMASREGIGDCEESLRT